MTWEIILSKKQNESIQISCRAKSTKALDEAETIGREIHRLLEEKKI